jgi:hypothetical protein
VSVTMPQSDFAVIVDLIRAQEFLETGEKLGFDPRFRNRSGIVRLMNTFRIDVALKHFPHPGQKSRQFFSTEFVPRAKDGDQAVFAETEARVAKAPDVEAFRFVRPWCRQWVWLDNLWRVRRNQTVILSVAAGELKWKNIRRPNHAIRNRHGRSFQNASLPTRGHL